MSEFSVTRCPGAVTLPSRCDVCRTDGKNHASGEYWSENKYAIWVISVGTGRSQKGPRHGVQFITGEGYNMLILLHTFNCQATGECVEAGAAMLLYFGSSNPLQQVLWADRNISYGGQASHGHA